jgi:hypothetical protein
VRRATELRQPDRQTDSHTNITKVRPPLHVIHTYILPFFNPLHLLQFFPTLSHNLSLLRLCGKHPNSASESAVISCVRGSVAVALARNLAATRKELTIDSPRVVDTRNPTFHRPHPRIFATIDGYMVTAIDVS